MRALKHRGPIGDAMQLTFRKHLRRCVELLTQDSTPTLNDAAVHEIRIKIKKARALLQLARAALSQRRYERVKRKLRTTSHCLGGLRDATVRLDTSKRLMRPANPAKRAALLLKLNRQLQAARHDLSLLQHAIAPMLQQKALRLGAVRKEGKNV